MQERWHKAKRRRNNSRKAALKAYAVVLMSQRTSPKGPITMFQVNEPDYSYSEDVVEKFYDMLQSKIDAIPKNQTYMISMPK